MKFYERWLMGWGELIDGILNIITLGFIKFPSLAYLICVSFSVKEAKRNLKK